MTVFELLFIAAVCLWLVITSRVHTGIINTIGLVLIACGCLAGTDANAFGERAVEVRTWGLITIGWGLIWKLMLRPAWLRLSNSYRLFFYPARWAGIEKRIAQRAPWKGKP